MGHGAGFNIAAAEQRAIALFRVLSRKVQPFARLEHRPLTCCAGNVLLPLRHARGEIRRFLHRFGFERAHFGKDFIAPLLLLRGGHFHERLVVIVQESKDGVVILLGKWIELVVVALATIDR